MIMHPGIISLLTGSFLSVLLVMKAAYIAARVLRSWDISSHSDQQLILERQTHIMDTVLLFTFFFQIGSFFLFLYTIDELHNLFTGAMCATGTLQTAPIGWYLIPLKISILFLSSLWLVLNFIDRHEEMYPLISLKSKILLFLFPMLSGDFVLSLVFFLKLDPVVITSCCGALFSDEATGILGDLNALSPPIMMVIFFSSGIIIAGLALAALFNSNHLLKGLLSVLSPFYFIIGILAIISFISLYIYETPTHHCPFDMLQSQNNFIGYFIYISLYVAVISSFLPGIIDVLEKKYDLSRNLASLKTRLLKFALFNILFFNMIVSWPIVFGEFTLFY